MFKGKCYWYGGCQVVMVTKSHDLVTRSCASNSLGLKGNAIEMVVLGCHGNQVT